MGTRQPEFVHEEKRRNRVIRCAADAATSLASPGLQSLVCEFCKCASRSQRHNGDGEQGADRSEAGTLVLAL